jgi:sulfhydrogenase subunit beta (sulfur reductase)
VGGDAAQPEQVLAVDGLDELVAALARRGFRVLGPQVRDGAIVYDDLERADDLPIGWRDVQAPGSYRLERRDDEARFGYAVGPHSWKRFFFPARVRLWRSASPTEFEEEPLDERPLALVGVRPCELAAIAIQDRVLLGGTHVDSDYLARRTGSFVVVVDCHSPADTCFCASTGSGPSAGPGYDLRLEELLDGEHRFLAQAGSETGAAVLAELTTYPAEDGDRAAAARALEHAVAAQTRRLEPDARDVVLRNLEHPRWEEVAERCLTCGNCTLACPTCFCTAVEDTTDLTDNAERWRTWDSCFSVGYSHIHGGATRPTPRARYRQWLTHKVATWPDQFGTLGCVGCGRCIAWCPVGIDLTEEVTALKAADEVLA